MPSLNKKFCGERAECAFMFQAMQRGMIVSKPFGDTASYDVVVEAFGSRRRGRIPTRLWRVQVKSVSKKTRHEYTIATRGAQNRYYASNEVDFFAAWVVPFDTWYIIPAAAVLPAKAAAFFPHVKRSRGKYEKFREAWHLLTQTTVA